MTVTLLSDRKSLCIKVPSFSFAYPVSVTGAFTDAKVDKPGKFELADGSTIFLDEIGNLSYGLQAKLLTALQRRSIVRVGGSTQIPINVRLVCATNRNLQQMVNDGEFREDLLYRINVEQAFAVQAGREVRIMVKPDVISDDQVILLARSIAKKIEDTLDYPGQIKVNVIRESRAVEYAK